MRSGPRPSSMWFLSAAVLGGVALGPVSASGAPPRQGVRLDPLQPASPESSFSRAEGPHAPTDDTVEYALGVGIEYASSPLRAVGVDAAGGEETLANVVDHAVLTRIGASIAPVRWLSVDMSLPVALYVKGQDEGTTMYAGQRSNPTASNGLGDLRFGMHARPIDTKAFDLLLGGRFWAPIGSDEAYLSDRRFRAEIDLAGAGDLGSMLYGATISVAPGLFGGRDGDRAAASLAAHAVVVPAFSLGVEPSVAFVYDVGPDEQGSVGVLVESLAALRLRAGGFQVALAGGPVFGHVAGAGEFRGLFNVAFVGGGRPSAKKAGPKKPEDRDLDGIRDEADACPDEAGPDSRDPAERGCPALDQDADRIRDAEDACPAQAGVKHTDAKANGCPDRDNDLVPDPVDGCAKEPGPEPFGCPKYARMTASGFKITPPIRFKNDKLSGEGRAALEEVAATMRANPKIEQISVQLGTRGASAAVSDKRAAAILLILRSGYLDSNRYEVVLSDELRAGSVQIRIVR